jgi:AAHS family 4-hydroxybenzoate transporter-like MFS transporter
MSAEPVDVNALIAARPLSRFQARIVMLCGFIALLDGFDLQTIGLAAPAIGRLLQVTPAAMGGVFSAALAGLTLGSFGLGSIADHTGRRPVLIGSTLCFGAFTLATPLAGSYGMLLAVRFLTGLGLGGAVPCCIALASEYTPPSRRPTAIALLWTGFPVGGVMVGLLGSWIIPIAGWQWLFWIGGAVPLLLAAVLWSQLPESIGYLVHSGAPAERIATLLGRVCGVSAPKDARFVLGEVGRRGNVLELFHDGRTRGTVLLWVGFFVVYLQLVSNSAWSPLLLSRVGMPVARSALAMAAFNFGSVIGTFSAGSLWTRIGSRVLLPVVLTATLLAYGSIGYFAPNLTMTIVLEAGVGLLLGCASSTFIALSALYYPTPIRTTGIGWAVGLGRAGSFIGPLLIGMLLGRGWSVADVFTAVAAPAALAALTAGLMPRPRL